MSRYAVLAWTGSWCWTQSRREIVTITEMKQVRKKREFRSQSPFYHLVHTVQELEKHRTPLVHIGSAESQTTPVRHFVAKVEPLFLDENPEPFKWSVVGIHKQLGESDYLWRAVPSVRTVNHDRSTLNVKRLCTQVGSSQKPRKMMKPLCIVKRLKPCRLVYHSKKKV